MGLFYCESTAPMPTLQVSHSISNTFSKFKKVKMGALVSFSVMSAKALLASLVKTKGPSSSNSCHRHYQGIEIVDESPVEDG